MANMTSHLDEVNGTEINFTFDSTKFLSKNLFGNWSENLGPFKNCESNASDIEGYVESFKQAEHSLNDLINSTKEFFQKTR